MYRKSGRIPSDGGWNAYCTKGYNMSLVSLILVLALVGLLVWLIQTFIPMDARIKNLMSVIVVIVLLLWVLQSIGLLTGGPVIRIR